MNKPKRKTIIIIASLVLLLLIFGNQGLSFLNSYRANFVSKDVASSREKICPPPNYYIKDSDYIKAGLDPSLRLLCMNNMGRPHCCAPRQSVRVEQLTGCLSCTWGGAVDAIADIDKNGNIIWRDNQRPIPMESVING